MPIAVPYFHSRGLDMAQVYQLQSIYAACFFLFELPTGYLSDMVSRRFVLLLHGIIWGVANTFLALSRGFGHLAIFEILAALGACLFSGSDIALLYDSLEELQELKGQGARMMGRTMFYARMGETCAALLCTALIPWGLSNPILAQACVGWIPLLISITLVEPRRDRLSASQHRENWRRILRKVLKENNTTYLIILSLISIGTATLLAVWEFQEYWKALNVPVGYFGLLWAAYNLVVAIAAWFAHRFDSFIGRPALIGAVGFLPVIGFLGMSFMGSPSGIFICLAFQLARGIKVVLLDALNMHADASMRATINSMVNWGVRLSFVILGPIFGILTDSGGVARASIFAAVFFLAAFGIIIVPLIRQIKSGGAHYVIIND